MTIHRKVKRVIDGDAFQTYRKVQGSDRIRIAEINAPEKNQFGGKQATARLRNQIQGKTVTLQPVSRSYGRVVADVRRNRILIR